MTKDLSKWIIAGVICVIAVKIDLPLILLCVMLYFALK